MNRAFFSPPPQCVVQAWPLRARVRGRGPARPEPAGVTQGRAPLAPLPTQRPPPTSPPARPPFRPAAARLGGSGLAGRLGSAAAAPVTATPRLRPGPAPPPPPALGPRAAATHPHFPGA